jgi:hypothetical protein
VAAGEPAGSGSTGFGPRAGKFGGWMPDGAVGVEAGSVPLGVAFSAASINDSLGPGAGA